MKGRGTGDSYTYVILPPKVGVLEDLYSQFPPSEASVNTAQGLTLPTRHFQQFQCIIVLILLCLCTGSPKSRSTYQATTNEILPI